MRDVPLMKYELEEEPHFMADGGPADVGCVVCPHCAFTFDAEHTDEGYGTDYYTCPACEARRLEDMCDHLRYAAESALESAKHWRQVSVRDRRERNDAVRRAAEDRYSDDVLAAVLHGLADRPDLDVSPVDRHRMRIAAGRLAGDVKPSRPDNPPKPQDPKDHDVA